MNLFYNEKGIGDTLLMNISDVNIEEREIETFGDVVRIFNRKTKETAGYNIFNASKYGNINASGSVQVTEEIEALISQAFSKNGLEDSVDLQQRPTFVVGYVEAKEKHPDADKLSVCTVNVGTESLQIVCGAPNVEAGQKVVVALTGAVMPSGLVIKQTTLRGVESSGMICSAKELALPDAPEEKGILVLGDTYEVGEAFTS